MVYPKTYNTKSQWKSSLFNKLTCHRFIKFEVKVKENNQQERRNQSGYPLVVSMLASSIQDRGSEPGRSRRIFRAKKSTACLPSERK
jgi:hypothetical protein